LRGQFKKSFQKNDILYSEIRPKNKRFAFIDFVANDYVASTKLMVLRHNNKILPEFLFHVLKNDDLLNYLQSQAETRSGTFPQITFTELGNIVINLPPIPTQRAIAATLSILDEKIESNRKINDYLEQIAQAIFKNWFDRKEALNWGLGTLSDIANINPLRKLNMGSPTTYLEMANLSTTGSFPIGWEKKEFAGGVKFKNEDTIISRITPCLENGKMAYINFLDDDEIAFGST
jgi:type I restriction enzyme S subunit